MKGWLIFLALCAFLWSVVYISKLVHNISPSLRVVESDKELSNLEVVKLGYKVTADRTYFRKIVYNEYTQTKGFMIRIRRDTVSNAVYYEEDK